MVADAVERFGGLDCLVNCAGGFSGLAHPHRRSLASLPIEEWDQAFDLNVKSIFLCVRAAESALRASHAGRVVSISSSAARAGAVQAGPAYVASKAAVGGLTRGLAMLLAPDRVTVNAIAPGGTTSERFLAAMAERGQGLNTPVRNPLARHGTPEEMAATIAFLLSDEASYITGATIDVNGGIWMV
jgi:NAD(P)-dependent dehydrogenase (short-subunit alcohol dehydrogenase family)